jgi:transposase
MKKKLFIGIDFSKKTFDVSVIHGSDLEEVKYKQFENTPKGCEELLKWTKKQTVLSMEDGLFCGEHTGLYGILLSEFLIKQGLFMWLENPAQIKLCSGLKREKNDKIDSKDIALYACRYQDKAKAYQLPDAALRALGLLLPYRERLLSNKQTLLVAANEIRAVLQADETAGYIYQKSKKQIEEINNEIKEVEEKMKNIIKANEALNETYNLVTSIKGIALINTVAIIVATQNFTRFETPRQFACYAGLAPFGKQSGTALNTQPHVSHWADKKIKVLLTQAAICAVRYDENLRNYYELKIAEGKHMGLVLNNVKNKLIHRIFAVVKHQEMYREDYFRPKYTKIG